LIKKSSVLMSGNSFLSVIGSNVVTRCCDFEFEITFEFSLGLVLGVSCRGLTSIGFANRASVDLM
jgi:hypothetical protein